MCFHRRLVLGCNHFVWLGILQPCEVEKAFQRGGLDLSCDVMWSHGYGTIRISEKCLRCTTIMTNDKSRFWELKGRIKALKEKLDSIKGALDVKEGEWLNPETDPGTNSDRMTEDGTAASCSSPEETAVPRDTSFQDGSVENSESMEDMEDLEMIYVDRKLRPFKLPVYILERMAKEVDERERRR
ncbi:hypothetical protein MMYC01_206497 [Madurella mycetomatis]|uniref:Uncharacterized protein n=1 Tax=Madurella mycetomatis TaxID=100816 RepID=A0A175W3H5_9PEZI|nr:hypothetical protein MMYC01_206497 [Madurella mycetomatis]